MRRFVMFLFILSMVVPVYACHKETEEDRVRKVIIDIQAAAEEENAGDIMDHISKTYNDSQGFNHENIKKMLLGYFLIYPKISVYITNLNISVENTSARVMFRAALTSGADSGSVADVIPRSFGMYDFDVSLKRESDDWKIVSATWAKSEVMNAGETGD